MRKCLWIVSFTVIFSCLFGLPFTHSFVTSFALNAAFAADAQPATTTQGDILKTAVVILNNKTLEQVEEIENLIKAEGGQVNAFVPPNLLWVKITDRLAEFLLQNPLVVEVSWDKVDPLKVSSYGPEVRKAAELNNQVQDQIQTIKTRALSPEASPTPFSDGLQPNPFDQLTPQERNDLTLRYETAWENTKDEVQSRILRDVGLEKSVDDSPRPLAAPATKNAPSNAPINYFSGTSNFMAGKVAVSIFFSGSWTLSRVDAVFAETVASMLLFQQDEPNAKLEFVFVKEVTGSTLHGVPSGFYAQFSHDNNLRRTLKTDWAYMVIVYSGTGRAWAYLNGPYHSLYEGDRRGGYVARHESCHIFGAMDQYHPDAGRSPVEAWGYLYVINANSQFSDGKGYFSGHGEGQNDIMISGNGNRALGAFTRGQLGWLDSDGDGLLDVFDTQPKTFFNYVGVDLDSNQIEVSGYAKDMPELNQARRPDYNQSPANGDVTLNKISSVAYRINGLSWLNVSPADGQWDSDAEAFSIQTPALPNGEYTLEVRATNNVGNTEKLPFPRHVSVNKTSNPVTDAAPFPAFSILPERTSKNENITLDAAASTDLEDNSAALRVRWDTNNDSVFETGWIALTDPQTVQYATSGNKTITMQVRDSAGHVASLSKDLYVSETNLVPQAKVVLSPENIHGIRSGNVSVDFDASASEDPEDYKGIQLRWQFLPSEDWTSWYDYSMGKLMTRNYFSPQMSSTQRMRLQVVDSQGAVAETTRSFWTVGYNHSPLLLNFDGVNVNGKVRVSNVSFSDADLGANWDPWRLLRWDVDSDGIWDTRFGPFSAMPEFVPATTGVAHVTCQIRDGFGARHQLTKDIPLTNVSPQLDIIENQTFTIGPVIHFPVSGYDVDNDPLHFSVQPLSGPSSAIEAAEILDNGDGTAVFSWDTQGAGAGPYVFRFILEDSKGVIVSRDVTFTLVLPRFNMTWKDLVGVTASGNSITKGAATAWGNGGAASATTFSGEGGVEFTAVHTNTYTFCGLSRANADANYATIDYAFYLKGGTVSIYESGVSIGNFGSYVAGEVFTVERNGVNILYRRNGNVIYTSTKTSTGNLLADASLYNQGSVISNAKIMYLPGVPNVSGLSAHIDNGTVQLSWSSADNGSPILSHQVQYGTVASGGFATVVQDDANPGITISGLTNSVEYQFRVVAKNSAGDSLPSDAIKVTPFPRQTINIIWTDLVGVTANNNSITKSAATGWGTGGAASIQNLSGDGRFEFTAAQNNAYAMCGLSQKNTDANYATIDYAVYLKLSEIWVYEKGTSMGKFGTYSPGDVFGVERSGSTIIYKRNGQTFYTSLVPVSAALIADASIYTQGSSINNARFANIEAQPPSAVTDLMASNADRQVALSWSAPSGNGLPISGYEIQYGPAESGAFGSVVQDDAVPGITISGLTNGTLYQFRIFAKNLAGRSPVSNVVLSNPRPVTNVVWKDLVGVTADGNTLTKTAATGWGNGGAASTNWLRRDGGIQFTAASTTTTVSCGLSYSNANASYYSIQWSIYLSGGSVYYYEGSGSGGALWGPISSYNVGDVFSLERIDNTIFYKKNGQTLPRYSFSGDKPVELDDLIIDVSLYDQGAVLRDVKFISIIPQAPNSVADLAATAGNQQVSLTWSAPFHNGSPITGYEVQYGTVESGSFDTVVQDDAVPGITVSGLTNNVTYQFRVIAKNASGSSVASNVVQVMPRFIIPVAWGNLAGVSVNGNTITKTAATGWGNGGAATPLVFSGDGGVEFTAEQNNAYVMCGLSRTNPDSGYSSIEYAIYLRDWILTIYESGQEMANFGSYAVGDVLSVERVGASIFYKRNGQLLYMSTKPSNGSLLVDASLHTLGGAIGNANITGVTPKEPDVVSGLSARVSDGQVDLTWSVPANNGSSITGYEIQYGTVASGGFATIVQDDAVAGRSIAGLVNGTEYQFRVVAKNALGASPVSDPVQAKPISKLPVTWVDPVGVTVSGNTLTKTAAAGWGNSAAATPLILSGDGGVEFTAAQTNVLAMCGLSQLNPDANYSSIEFSVFLKQGAVVIYESGKEVANLGAYAAGDVFSVERGGTSVQYKRNGQLLYTSAKESRGPLLVDASLYTQGAVIQSAQIIGLVPRQPEAVTGLNAKVGDRKAELSWNVPANNGSVITGYEIQYGTVASGGFASVVQDDAIAGATISGLTNGIEYQFRVIAKNALGNSAPSNAINATPMNNQAVPVEWVNLVGASVDANTITKTAATGWGNSGAVSSLSFRGDGSVEFTATQTNTYAMCGLSRTNPDSNYASIEFAIYLKLGVIQVYESGANAGSFGSYAAGDVFTIERAATSIRYRRNGQLFYTSSKASTGSLWVDASLYTPGAVISDAKFVGITPQEPSPVMDFAASNGDQQVSFTWSAPANNGSVITGYEVQYGTVASGGFATVVQDDATPGMTITGLTNNVEYQFRVVAKNAVGSSPASSAARAVPMAMINITWRNLVGTGLTQTRIHKSAVNGWGNGGASSQETILANGRVQFPAYQTGVYMMCGLSKTDADADYKSIDYAIYLKSNVIAVYEKGILIGEFGSFVQNDLFSIDRVGSTIVYRKNGRIFYTSTRTTSDPLLFDMSIYTQGGMMDFVKINRN